eukprot:RCo027289
MEELKDTVDRLARLGQAGLITTLEMQCMRDAAISFYLGLPADPKMLLAMHRPFSRARRSLPDLPTTLPLRCCANLKHCPLSAVQLSDRQHAVGVQMRMGFNPGAAEAENTTQLCGNCSCTACSVAAADATPVKVPHPRRNSEDPTLLRKQQQRLKSSVTVQLGRLPVGATQAEVEGLLEGLPGLRSVRLVYRRDGFFSGKALVHFTDPRQASAARDHVVRSGATLKGHPIEVQLALPNGRPRSHSV